MDKKFYWCLKNYNVLLMFYSGWPKRGVFMFDFLPRCNISGEQNDWFWLSLEIGWLFFLFNLNIDRVMDG